MRSLSIGHLHVEVLEGRSFQMGVNLYKGGSTREASFRPHGIPIAVTFKRATYYEVQWGAAAAERLHTLHIIKCIRLKSEASIICTTGE